MVHIHLRHRKGAQASTTLPDPPLLLYDHLSIPPPLPKDHSTGHSTMSNASSASDLSVFPTPITSSISLEGKANAKIVYTFYPPSKSQPHHINPFSKTLIVFLNGLILPRSSWEPSIIQFLEKRCSANLPFPAILSYDRYGQGDSDRDPEDVDPPPCHGHDLMSAVHSLKSLLLQIWKTHLTSTPSQFPSLIFVGSSIGCALARLYAATYPGTVHSLLLLDSTLTDSDFVSLWPDPDEPHFDPHSLPPGVSEKDVRDTRRIYHDRFHPSIPNNEGLTRRNICTLLPSPSSPRLIGPDSAGPYVTIVGHDWEAFAEENYTQLGVPKVLTMTYMNPVWQRYNDGLRGISEEEKVIGPIVAVGCGHFVPRDGPGFVGGELGALLDRGVNRVEQVWEGDDA
ncbi:hypothetical protein P154DRAFT_521647 [Amniculicola lignicola CBS 123094]|uniref:AB hydrolase-1 domain-containing protein n=1 Tax=Amniculicola lignicola CBS 123094 TaxID=1392246 RepID=A0A6A5WR94_9PLEO|nr:hypothetical protein P154DRAFT_521647 [Amniculicola lignicola CBS 123094]